MAAAHARHMQRDDPRPVLVVGRGGKIRGPHNVWWGNPRIANAGPVLPSRADPERYQILEHGPGVRPYLERVEPARFVYRLDYRIPGPGEIYLHADELAVGAEVARRCGRFVLIEPNTKERASPNKRWCWKRWQALIQRFPRVTWLQNHYPGGELSLAGVRGATTRTFREACAVLRFADAYVGVEGGMHHAAAALGVPAVVVFGGMTSPAVTGYSAQRSLYVAAPESPCGRRVPCRHCDQAMDSITVEALAGEVAAVLDEPRGCAR